MREELCRCQDDDGVPCRGASIIQHMAIHSHPPPSLTRDGPAPKLERGAPEIISEAVARGSQN